MPIESGL